MRFLRFKYRLRTLLVFVAVVGCGAALAGKRLATIQQQRIAVSEISRTGGTFYWDYQFTDEGFLGSKDFGTAVSPPGPKWFRRMAGDDVFANVEYVEWLWDANVADGDLAILAKLPRLRTLLIIEAGLTDKALVHLSHVPNLEVFVFRGDRITTRGIKQIGHLTRLHHLNLTNTTIDDDAMPEIAKLKRLTHLTLSGTAITDEGLAHLLALPQLIWLDLDDTLITDNGARQLAKVDTLKCLNIAGTSISDKGIAILSSLSEVTTLNIAGTDATDQSVASLVQLPKLKLLVINHIVLGRGLPGVRDKIGTRHLTTNISDAALNQFKSERPDVDIGH